MDVYTWGSLGFEDNLWTMADRLRGTMDATEHNYALLGLILLECYFGFSTERYKKLLKVDDVDTDDYEEYDADAILSVLSEDRWNRLQCRAGGSEIDQLIDDLMFNHRIGMGLIVLEREQIRIAHTIYARWLKGLSSGSALINCRDLAKDSRRIIFVGPKLTQSEADVLLSLAKHYRGSKHYEFPGLGGSLSIPLVSNDARTKFQIDIWRGGIKLQKDKFQSRAHQIIILARLDVGGQPHRNPDGVEIPSPHLHIYREGYNDKWAFTLPEVFSNTSDRYLTLNQFMDYCNVVTKPTISRGLFV